MENPFKKLKTGLKIGVASAILSSLSLNAHSQTETSHIKNDTNLILFLEKNIENFDSIEPIIVHDPKDPRLLEYKKNLDLYNKSIEWINNVESLGYTFNGSKKKAIGIDKYSSDKRPESGYSFNNFFNYTPGYYTSGYNQILPLTTPIKKTKTQVTWKQQIGSPKLNKFNTYTLDENNTPLTLEFEPSNHVVTHKEALKLGFDCDTTGTCPWYHIFEVVPVYEKPKQKVIYFPDNITDNNVWGWKGDTKVVGYYNKGDKKGRIDVTIDDLKKWDDAKFKEVFPDTRLTRQGIIDLWDYKNTKK